MERIGDIICGAQGQDLGPFSHLVLAQGEKHRRMLRTGHCPEPLACWQRILFKRTGLDQDQIGRGLLDRLQRLLLLGHGLHPVPGAGQRGGQRFSTGHRLSDYQDGTLACQ